MPLDGSYLSERALQPALQLAEQFEAQITLLRVIAVDQLAAASAGSGSQFLELSDLREERERTESEDYLHGILTQCRAANVPTVTRVAFGAAPEMIVLVAEQTNAELIVMSTYGRSGLNRFLYGSVA